MRKYVVQVTYHAVGEFYVDAEDAESAEEEVRARIDAGIEPDCWLEYEADEIEAEEDE